MSCQLNTANVQTHKRLSLEPNTETIVWARVPNYNTLGLQDTIPEVQHVEVSETIDSPHSQFTRSKPDYSKVKSLLTLPENFQETELDELACLLHDNLDLFVTEDNPNLGFTRVVEHKILLKPDAVGKHLKPYRLPPYKREILREHLDNLLKEGIIAPVSETEDLLITSPIVLVTKRSKNSGKPCAQDLRFCCDFRFLKSQTREFKYSIPDLKKLTESFSEVISSIDLSSGFFQMGLSNDSSQYTAFNTCFGTYKFRRLPMGLKTAPNTFQMLMDKQFSFEIVYKKADDMQVPDALSRCENSKADAVESPVEDDPFFFPFVEDVCGKVKLPNGKNFSELIASKVADVQAVHLTDNAHSADTFSSDLYDADTDESDDKIKKKKSVRKMSKQRRTLYKSVTGIADKTLKTSVFEDLPISTEKIKQLQRQDITLTKIIDYLENDTLPESQKEARRVLLKSSDYALIDKVLFHSRIAKAKRNKMMDHYQINGKNHSRLCQSCHLCQIRKVSNKKTKQEIVSFPTPAEPFQVWQMDICGPYPVSVNGNTYVFTAVDMFTKLLFAYPLRNKDAITVCEAIYRMFTAYGVCQTLISDRGSEFTNKCTAELCKLLEVTQEFTPAFAHHCLGACERQHRTLAERLTTHVLKGKPWKNELYSVIFSMNSSVNNSIDFSPFEILYGKRPNFPLIQFNRESFKDIPVDMRTYFQELTCKLNTTHETVSNNAIASGLQMEEKENLKTNTSNLKLSIGDYVYLQREPTGVRRKFQPIFDGPYIVNNIPSSHLIKLRDPTGKRKLSDPVHINRLKIAHIRAPDPAHCLAPLNAESTESEENETLSSSKDGDIEKQQSASVDSEPHVKRSTRKINKPLRFRDENFVTANDIESSTDAKSEKVKRILAKKKNGNQSFLYLIQLVGKPSQNAQWRTLSQLSQKEQELLISRPPPLVK
ncbi:unnamed protein product [Mytilus coruscus]|uniref:Integrase catalytic domain-containing protein n=1 Tax=Mytilus coruscus TaxID=42192 RepID=A0A6J8C8X5_MYTCO|nr:unnamed protein product [Mytilus coruscus]